MDESSRGLYLRALQSTRVEVRGPGLWTFPVPIDLIYKRSEYVRQTIHWSRDEETTAYISFVDTPVVTLEAFVIWVYAAKPVVSPHATFEDMVELAIFADTYSMEALHNQALDVLRHKLRDGEWKLQPHVVRRAYGALHAETPLRKLCRVLLNTAREELQYNGGRRRDMDTWALVLETCPEMGKDYYVATCENYDAAQVSGGGPCQYHWHRDLTRQDINRVGEIVCPFNEDACFMDWDKFDVPGGLRMAGAEAGPGPAKMSKKEKKRMKKAKLPSRNIEDEDEAILPASEEVFLSCAAPEPEVALIDGSHDQGTVWS